MQLMDFIALQRHIFSSALQYVKPKTGKIVYITCSILDEENVHQVGLNLLRFISTVTGTSAHRIPSCAQ